jgi:hypothetical protein
MVLPGVARRGFAHDQPALFEAAQRSAQIAGVEIERAADIGCGRRAAFENLVEYARLGKRIGAAEIGLTQHAELARVEAIEPPHPGDAIGAHPILLAIVGGAPSAMRAFARAASISVSRHAGSLGQILD